MSSYKIEIRHDNKLISFGPRFFGEFGKDILAVKVALGLVMTAESALAAANSEDQPEPTLNPEVPLDNQNWFECGTGLNIDIKQASKFDQRLKNALIKYQMDNQFLIVSYLFEKYGVRNLISDSQWSGYQGTSAEEKEYSKSLIIQIDSALQLFENEFGTLQEGTLAIMHGWRPKSIISQKGYVHPGYLQSDRITDVIPEVLYKDLIGGKLGQTIESMEENYVIYENSNVISTTEVNLRPPGWPSASLFGGTSSSWLPPMPGGFGSITIPVFATIDYRPVVGTNSVLYNAAISVLNNREAEQEEALMSYDDRAELLRTMLYPDPFTNPDPFEISATQIGFFDETNFVLDSSGPLPNEDEDTIRELEDRALQKVLDYYSKPDVWNFARNPMDPFFEVAYFKGETPPAPDHVGHFPKNITEEIRDRIPRLSIIKSAIEAKKKELEVKMSRASVSTFFDQIGAGDEGVEQLEAFWDGSEPNTWDERSPRERKQLNRIRDLKSEIFDLELRYSAQPSPEDLRENFWVFGTETKISEFIDSVPGGSIQSWRAIDTAGNTEPLIKFVEYRSPTQRPGLKYRAFFKINREKLNFINSGDFLEEEPQPSTSSTRAITEEEVCLDEGSDRALRANEEYKIHARQKRRQLVRKFRESVQSRSLGTHRASVDMGPMGPFDLNSAFSGLYELGLASSDYEYTTKILSMGGEFVNSILEDAGIALSDLEEMNKILEKSDSLGNPQWRAPMALGARGQSYAQSAGTFQINYGTEQDEDATPTFIGPGLVDRIKIASKDLKEAGQIVQSKGIQFEPGCKFNASEEASKLENFATQLTEFLEFFGVPSSEYVGEALHIFTMRDFNLGVKGPKNGKELVGYNLDYLTKAGINWAAIEKEFTKNKSKYDALLRPRTLNYVYNLKEMVPSTVDSGVPGLPTKAQAMSFFQDNRGACEELGIDSKKNQAIAYIGKFTSGLKVKQDKNPKKSQTVKSWWETFVEDPASEWAATGKKNWDDSFKDTLDEKQVLDAFGKLCTLDDLYKEFFDKVSLPALLCDYIKCLKLPGFSLKLPSFKLPPFPKVPIIGWYIALVKMLIKEFKQILIRILCTMVRTIIDKLAFPFCEEEMKEFIAAGSSGSPIMNDALTAAFLETGVPKGKEEQSKDFFEDSSNILTNQELCYILQGKPLAPATMTILSRLVEKNGLSEDLETGEDVVNYFGVLGAYVPLDLCQELATPLPDDSSCSEIADAVQAVRDKLLAGSGEVTDEQIDYVSDLARKNAEDRLQRAQALSGASVDNLVPPVLDFNNPNALMPKLPDLVNNHIQSMVEGMFLPAKGDYISALSTYVESMRMTTPDSPWPGEEAYNHTEILTLESTIEQLCNFSRAVEYIRKKSLEGNEFADLTSSQISEKLEDNRIRQVELDTEFARLETQYKALHGELVYKYLKSDDSGILEQRRNGYTRGPWGRAAAKGTLVDLLRRGSPYYKAQYAVEGVISALFSNKACILADHKDDWFQGPLHDRLRGGPPSNNFRRGSNPHHGKYNFDLFPYVWHNSTKIAKDDVTRPHGGYGKELLKQISKDTKGFGSTSTSDMGQALRNALGQASTFASMMGDAWADAQQGTSHEQVKKNITKAVADNWWLAVRTIIENYLSLFWDRMGAEFHAGRLDPGQQLVAAGNPILIGEGGIEGWALAYHPGAIVGTSPSEKMYIVCRNIMTSRAFNNSMLSEYGYTRNVSDMPHGSRAQMENSEEYNEAKYRENGLLYWDSIDREEIAEMGNIIKQMGENLNPYALGKSEEEKREDNEWLIWEARMESLRTNVDSDTATEAITQVSRLIPALVDACEHFLDIVEQKQAIISSMQTLREEAVRIRSEIPLLEQAQQPPVVTPSAAIELFRLFEIEIINGHPVHRRTFVPGGWTPFVKWGYGTVWHNPSQRPADERATTGANPWDRAKTPRWHTGQGTQFPDTGASSPGGMGPYVISYVDYFNSLNNNFEDYDEQEKEMLKNITDFQLGIGAECFSETRHFFAMRPKSRYAPTLGRIGDWEVPNLASATDPDWIHNPFRDEINQPKEEIEISEEGIVQVFNFEEYPANQWRDVSRPMYANSHYTQFAESERVMNKIFFKDGKRSSDPANIMPDDDPQLLKIVGDRVTQLTQIINDVMGRRRTRESSKHLPMLHKAFYRSEEIDIEQGDANAELGTERVDYTSNTLLLDFEKALYSPKIKMVEYDYRGPFAAAKADRYDIIIEGDYTLKQSSRDKKVFKFCDAIPDWATNGLTGLPYPKREAYANMFLGFKKKIKPGQGYNQSEKTRVYGSLYKLATESMMEDIIYSMYDSDMFDPRYAMELDARVGGRPIITEDCVSNRFGLSHAAIMSFDKTILAGAADEIMSEMAKPQNSPYNRSFGETGALEKAVVNIAVRGYIRACLIDLLLKGGIAYAVWDIEPVVTNPVFIEYAKAHVHMELKNSGNLNEIWQKAVKEMTNLNNPSLAIDVIVKKELLNLPNFSRQIYNPNEKEKDFYNWYLTEFVPSIDVSDRFDHDMKMWELDITRRNIRWEPSSEGEPRPSPRAGKSTFIMENYVKISGKIINFIVLDFPRINLQMSPEEVSVIAQGYDVDSEYFIGTREFDGLMSHMHRNLGTAETHEIVNQSSFHQGIRLVQVVFDSKPNAGVGSWDRILNELIPFQPFNEREEGSYASRHLSESIHKKTYKMLAKKVTSSEGDEFEANALCVPLSSYERELNMESCPIAFSIQGGIHNKEFKKLMESELLEVRETKLLFENIFPCRRYMTLSSIFATSILGGYGNLPKLMTPTKSMLSIAAQIASKPFNERSQTLGVEDFNKMMKDKYPGDPDDPDCFEFPGLSKEIWEKFWKELKDLILQLPSILFRGVANQLDPAYKEMRSHWLNCDIKDLDWRGIGLQSVDKGLVNGLLLPRDEADRGQMRGRYIPIVPDMPIDLIRTLFEWWPKTPRRLLKTTLKTVSYVYSGNLPMVDLSGMFKIPCLEIDESWWKDEKYDAGYYGRYGHPLSPFTMLALSTPALRSDLDIRAATCSSRPDNDCEDIE